MVRLNYKAEKKALESAGEGLALCLRLLQKRRYTEGELRRKLEERGLEQALCDEVMYMLQQEGRLDDRGFVLALLDYRARISYHGRYALMTELQRRGVCRELQQYASSCYTLEAEAEAAYCYLQRCGRRCDGAERQEAELKLRTALARRGFGSEAAACALSSYFDE